MPIYEYLCKCGLRFDQMKDIEDRHTARCECGNTARMEMSAPNFSLDVASGDFPSALNKWAKAKEKANYDDLQELGLRGSQMTHFIPD